MRRLLFALLLATTFTAHAAKGGPEQAIMEVARATGMSNQFSARCGMDPDVLKRHKAKFEGEANAANARLPAGHEVDINAEYKVGSDEADRYYDSVKDSQSRAMVCQAMAAQVNMALSGPGVLTIPVR